MNEYSSTVNHRSPRGPLSLAHDSDTLHLERRSHPRRAVQQRVTAAITNLTDRSDATLRICSLLLTDLSPVGAGAMVQEPLPLGAQITVFCPPHGSEAGFDLQGTIVRCRQNADDAGYNLGIRVEAHMAA